MSKSKQLREWADAIESGNWPMFGYQCAEVFRQHAEVIEALEPARQALNRIDLRPNDMDVRRDAEIASFYAAQRCIEALKWKP